MEQIRRSTRAWKNAVTQEKREKWELAQSFEANANRLGITQREWHLFAQQLMIEGKVDTFKTHTGQLMYKERLPYEVNYEGVFDEPKVEVHLREYLSIEQFELFEVFRNKFRPMTIQQAMLILEDERSRQSEFRRPFGMTEAENTLVILEKMGFMERIHYPYFPNESDFGTELRERNIHTLVLWRVADGGDERA